MPTIRVKLFNTLDDLNEEQFKRFKFYLKEDGVLEGSSRIPASKVEKADRMEMVELMIQQYKSLKAQKITRNILEKIGRNDLIKSRPRGPGLGLTPSVSAVKRPKSTKSVSARVPAPTASVSAVKRLRSAQPQSTENAIESVFSQLGQQTPSVSYQNLSFPECPLFPNFLAPTPSVSAVERPKSRPQSTKSVSARVPAQTPSVSAVKRPKSRPKSTKSVSARVPAQTPSVSAVKKPKSRPKSTKSVSARVPAQTPSVSAVKKPKSRPKSTKSVSARVPAQTPSVSAVKRPKSRPKSTKNVSARVPAQTPSVSAVKRPRCAQPQSTEDAIESVFSQLGQQTRSVSYQECPLFPNFWTSPN